MDRSRRTTRDTYDRISAHFAKTREYAWPEVESFVADAPAGERGLDLGCGNARHAEVLTSKCDHVVGLDLSRGLLDTARERATGRDFAVDLVQGDASRLPIRDDSVDLAVYVATLHHLPTREARRASLNELARVLTPGGRALVSVWSTAHDTFDREESFDTEVDWTLPGGVTVPRYYHIYSPDEFDADLESSDCTVLHSELSSGNCYATITASEQ
ncbi:class I SAM-dependent methyltransferase [Haloarchaeobius sp. DFWS5]|uniref:class I SAM-dependent methyltransferase n=1 Tax=Haloarchaeobius sp. DFWS5 TaxID=3446114 RepID=UPI003EB8CF50